MPPELAVNDIANQGLSHIIPLSKANVTGARSCGGPNGQYIGLGKLGFGMALSVCSRFGMLVFPVLCTARYAPRMDVVKITVLTAHIIKVVLASAKEQVRWISQAGLSQ